MKGAVTRRYTVLIFIPIIVLLAWGFHYEVHFEDALALAPDKEYRVAISFWRIIFEPFVGPVLYWNRSIYVLTELPLTFFWALVFYLAAGTVEVFRNTFSKKGIIIEKLTNIPMVVGICFAIFVAILFLPLPNNTIENKSENGVLVTTHAHTQFSHDGLITQENLWKWHKKNGFDAFFITDHNNHLKTLEFSKEQRLGKLPMHPLVMVGEEFSGSNHMSLLGLHGSFNTKGMTDKAVIDSVHYHGGAVIINHWFDGKGKEKEHYEALGANGFEIENAGKALYYDRALFAQLRKFCEDKGLTMVGGLDFHGYGRVCSLYNAFQIPYWDTLDAIAKEKAIIDILKNGPQEKLKILLYKDRPFYEESSLLFRPFITLVNYFRTLNVAQVASWIFWLLILQGMANRYQKRPVWLKGKATLIFSFASALFVLVLGMAYYLRGKAVVGYSDLYSEYSVVLIPTGLGLLFYGLVILYARQVPSRKKRRPEN
ncbi:PHP domain-containing protein [Maribacter sp. 2307ULW6-5]|uniref:PHP domain-containing protein n=1 Tax=Maribacter sp. 2307ULW6-5 TaxID=3386275 RepID=UPI0039BC57DC